MGEKGGAGMIIKYVNSSGASIVLNQGPYLISSHDLRDFSWERKVTNRPSGVGGRVTFSRPVQEKRISIGIRGRELFAKNAAALMALTEPDILNNTPGRLYLGDQYLICFLAVASKVNRYAEKSNWVSKDLTVLVTEPFWNTEVTQHFLIGAPDTVEKAKRYTGRYPYRYIAEFASRALHSSHYTTSPMIITIYGPVVNPRIVIGGKEYKVTAEIIENQRIIIDQINKTIVAKNPDGQETNLFDYRDKENDVFARLEAGTQHVIYTGEFGFDITVIQQRSEPSWI